MSKNSDISNQVHFKRLGRELAMQFLFQVDLNIEIEEEMIEAFWEQAEESGKFPHNRVFRKGREYAETLIHGIVEHRKTIDDMILSKSEKWDLRRMAVVDRNIMRVAVYEMLFVADVPPVVSINEAVGISRLYSSDQSGPFINGLLNAVKDGLDRPAREAVDKL
ncbi:MAG: transcription antitermination factor NusB [Victivallales bacterium]|nr:transcription antitermination factor NusB [Victivallales bacterium]